MAKKFDRVPLTKIAWYRHGGRMAIADLMWCKVHGLVSHQPAPAGPAYGPHPMRTLDQMMSGTLEVTLCPDTDLFTASPSEHDYFWDVINHRQAYIAPKPVKAARKATWYWRIWWWIGYHGIYQIGWWWKKRGTKRARRYIRPFDQMQTIGDDAK